MGCSFCICTRFTIYFPSLIPRGYPKCPVCPACVVKLRYGLVQDMFANFFTSLWTLFQVRFVKCPLV
jgi:hypothetical protein